MMGPSVSPALRVSAFTMRPLRLGVRSRDLADGRSVLVPTIQARSCATANPHLGSRLGLCLNRQQNRN